MKNTLSWLRPWFVPTLLVCVAGVLTVPWSYFVLKAAYDRDVTENARALARRVEIQRSLTYPQPVTPLDPFFQLREQARDKALRDALRTEIGSDPSVKTLISYNILYKESLIEGVPPSAIVQYIVGKRSSDPRGGGTPEENREEEAKAINRINRLTANQRETLRRQGIIRIDESESKVFLIPWIKGGQLQGVTYVELSDEALSNEFWKKELGLFRRVIAWSATGVLALSAVGIFAYRSWEKAGRVQHRADLARQGLLAERGLTAAVLAHEIRNPLQALRFQLHSLRKNSADPARVTGTAETIDSELSRIQQLVTDYLEHEKAASVRVQSVELRPAAEMLKTVMDEMLRDRDTRLDIVGDGEPVVVSCDPHALRQVLMNLVLNAQQAMGVGGQITIRVGRDDGFGTIDVTDTGPGIPEEMRARLFKPFQTSKKDGHGIGLALVKRFVDNFGGSVAVDTEVGRGTTFHLKLPLAGVDSTAAPEGALNVPSEVQKIEA